MAFQHYALYPHMTVAGNIAYGLRVARVAKAERRRRAAEIAQLVQLDGMPDRKPAELSGGQRQRVAMARAIIRTRRAFLFYEPLSNLDAELRVQIRHEVRRIHEEVRATSIFVAHDQTEAMTLADKLVVMRGGGILQVGAPREVYERPRTLFVAGFIGSPSMGTLPVRLGEDRTTLHLRDGQTLPLGGQLPHAAPGSALVVGVRPEAPRFSASGLAGRHAFSEELGTSRSRAARSRW